MKPNFALSLSLFAVAVLLYTSTSGMAAQPASKVPADLSGTNEVTETSTNSFNADVLNSRKPVLVDFYATWCGPCKQMAPVVEELSRDYSGSISIFKVDIDKNPALATKYAVHSIPTLKLFRGGAAVDEAVGLIPKSELRHKLDALLKPSVSRSNI